MLPENMTHALWPDTCSCRPVNNFIGEHAVKQNNEAGAHVLGKGGGGSGVVSVHVAAVCFIVMYQ